MSTGKSYKPPHLKRYQSEAECPDWVRDAVQSIRQEVESEAPRDFAVKPDLVTVLGTDRKFVEVSDSFCQLLGYRREELIGKPYDDVTAPNTTDIPTVFRLLMKHGYMHGLWMLASRRGTRVLVRYESRIRPDSYIEGRMEVVGAGY
jgi:PAS domain S-box-containing protein